MAQERELRAGDMVRLRSGGPRMTLLHFAKPLASESWQGDVAVCGWFVGIQDDKLKQARVPRWALELVPEPKPASGDVS